LERRGSDTSNFTPVCRICGARRRLDFARATYSPCPCQKLDTEIRQREAEIKKIDRKLGEETDSTKKRLLGNQKGAQKQRLNKALAKQAALAASRESNVSVLAASDLGLLYMHGGQFVELLKSHQRVYDAYERLLDETIRPELSIHRVASLNRMLHSTLEEERWVSSSFRVEGMCLYVHAFDAKELERGNRVKETWYREISYPVAAYERLRSSIEGNEPAIQEWIGSHPGSFRYRWTGNRDACWFFMLYPGADKRLIPKLNPLVLMTIHQALNDSSGPNEVRGQEVWSK